MDECGQSMKNNRQSYLGGYPRVHVQAGFVVT